MRIVEIFLMTLGGLWQGVRMDLNLVEIAAIAAGFWLWKKRGWRPRWNRLPNPSKSWMWALGIALGVVLLRLALLPALPAPVPIVTDEFSHLLLADTLYHGRLANDTHPFWPHFESLHIIQQPHYVSNYFPGTAAVLTLGRVLTGSPWAGVLAECSVFLALLYWALRGWMPARWSLLGVLLAALRFGIGSYWVNAFHGGFVPAIGGALVFGAFGRLLWEESARLRSRFGGGTFVSMIFGMGLAIMALSRPYEGALYAIPILAVLCWRRRGSVGALATLLVPVVLFTALAAGALGIYMKHVTGSPFVSAYQISQKTYGWPMGLAWTPPPKIEHRHVEFERYYTYELSERETVDGPLDFAEYLTFRVQEYWRFFVGPILSIPLLFLGGVWKRRRMLFLALSGAGFAVMLEGAASPHYIACATAVIVAILVECIRHLRAARWGIAGALPFAMAAILALRIVAQNTHVPYSQEINFQSWCCRVEGNLNKSRISRTLEASPGNHLVFVKAKTERKNLYQWIYNEADIDQSRIVWARDLGDARNAELCAYYKDLRKVWMVDPNVEPAAITPYTPGDPNSFAKANAAPAAKPPITAVRTALLTSGAPVK
jgi:hypothetical protein